MYEFRLPDVGEGIHEAEVLRWLVNAGDTVQVNQPILEIQTDKAVVEIPSPVKGTIAEIRAEAGTLAAVGDTLIVIVAADEEEVPAPQPTNHKLAPSSAPTTATGTPARRSGSRSPSRTTGASR